MDFSSAAWFGQWDIDLLVYLRSFVDPHTTLAQFVSIYADLPVFVVVLSLVIWWLLGVYHRSDVYRREALKAFFMIASVFVVYAILNQFLPERPRPETIVPGIAPLIDHTPDNSFPSGHAAFAAAATVAVAMLFERRWLTIFVWLIGLDMCVVRVMAGIHYPSDIIAGWIIGTLVAYSVHISTHRYSWIYDRFLVAPLLWFARMFHL